MGYGTGISMIGAERIYCYKKGIPQPGPVVYWMQRDQRVDDNWALFYAQQEARKNNTGLLVVFCLVGEFLKASGAHFEFMKKGLDQVHAQLEKLHIPFILLQGTPPQKIPEFIGMISAGLLVTDFNPLHLINQWKNEVKNRVKIPFYEVDAHNICPARTISDKQEYSAFTLRKKITRRLQSLLMEIPSIQPMPEKNHTSYSAILKSDNPRFASDIWPLTPTPSPYSLPSLQLDDFIANHLSDYDRDRNDPNTNGQSGLSPFLHFGQIAAQRIALEVQQADAPSVSKQAFLEELIVRKELSDNYCLHNNHYDTFEGFPKWGQQTLNKHRDDPRPYLYDLKHFEQGTTHDPLWNAAQQELIQKAKMHGYMRMYWAKKILEWTQSPEEAQAIAIHLNDTFSMDGRDPNGYAGIAWSIGGVHDRPWKERPVFGMIRYMNEAGCRRKFDVDKYINTYVK
jgi:deoxyribodipyrimidine photo-lyase